MSNKSCYYRKKRRSAAQKQSLALASQSRAASHLLRTAGGGTTGTQCERCAERVALLEAQVAVRFWYVAVELVLYGRLQELKSELEEVRRRLGREEEAYGEGYE